MKVVCTNATLQNRVGDFESIKLLKNAGFDGFDFNLFNCLFDKEHEVNKIGHIAYAKKLKAYADSLNFPCTQTHSARAGVLYPNTTVDFDYYVDAQIKSIEMSEILGAKNCVVHPIIFATIEDNINLYYAKMLPTAEKLGVTVCTENMFMAEKENGTFYPATCGFSAEFCEIIDKINSKYFKACVDIGHAEMPNAEGASKMLKALGKDRISALHVHDNTKIDDDHFIPFNYGGRIRWIEIINALKEIGYNGDFTFEAHKSFHRYPTELLEEGFRHMCAIGRYFVEKLTK